MGLAVAEGEGLQLASLAAPGRAQAEGQLQGWQVALEAAPVALLNVPAGHAVALTEEGGQKPPAGHGAGASVAEAQVKEAGHCARDPEAQ